MKLQWFFVLLLSALSSSGQVGVTGIVTDGQQVLPSVTLLLLGEDSTVVTVVVTDTAGVYRFNSVKPGRYLVSASMIGYLKFTSRPINVERSEVRLVDIVLGENVKALNEVVITSEKQLFEQQRDRLVINVGSSITSSGSTVLEMLQKSPGVVVNKENNSITMNGRSGVRIMIDEKMMQVPLDVAMQMLDGMTTSNVEKIELISTPPSKYDAEGNAGIIHIVTKGNTEMGTNSSIGLTLGARWAEALGGNFSIHHRRPRFAYGIDYAVVRNHNLHSLEVHRESSVDGIIRTISVKSRRENITTQQNLNAGFEWSVTKNTLLNLLVSGYRRNWDLNATATNVNLVTASSEQTTEMNIHESNIWQSATASIGILHRFHINGELGISVDYLYYHNTNPSQYHNTLNGDQSHADETFDINLQKITPIKVVVARVDYKYELSQTLSLDVGFKGIASKLDNNVLVQRQVNDDWTTDPDFTSYSSLTENIGAGYIAFRWQPTNLWQVQGGLRYEYTHTEISTPTQRNLVNRKYGCFFPSFSWKKNFDPERDIQFAYARRITRPTYNDIAPYVFFWGPNTFSAGNTSLYPAVSDAVTMGYHVKQWIVSLQYSHVKNEIVTLQPELDPQSDALIYRSQNLTSLNTLGLTNSISFPLLPWWEMNGTVTVQYQVATTTSPDNDASLRQCGMNVNLVNQVRLPKGFSMEVGGMYQSQSISGNSIFLPYGALNVGVQKSFGDKGTLRLAMDDILNTNNWRIRTNSSDNFTSAFNYNWHNQYLRVTYTLNMGNNGLRTFKAKSGSEEERGRVN